MGKRLAQATKHVHSLPRRLAGFALGHPPPQQHDKGEPQDGEGQQSWVTEVYYYWHAAHRPIKTKPYWKNEQKGVQAVCILIVQTLWRRQFDLEILHSPHT